MNIFMYAMHGKFNLKITKNKMKNIDSEAFFFSANAITGSVLVVWRTELKALYTSHHVLADVWRARNYCSSGDVARSHSLAAFTVSDFNGKSYLCSVLI